MPFSGFQRAEPFGGYEVEKKAVKDFLLGKLSFARGGSADEKTMLSFSEDIYNEAQRLILLVNDILKLSKLDEVTYTEFRPSYRR